MFTKLLWTVEFYAQIMSCPLTYGVKGLHSVRLICSNFSDAIFSYNDLMHTYRVQFFF